VDPIEPREDLAIDPPEIDPSPTPLNDLPQLSAQPFLGRRLREIRRERAFSLATVADGTGISQSFLSQVENGHSDITLGRLLRLVDLYGLDIADVIPPGVGHSAEVIRFADLQFSSFADPAFAMAVLAREGPQGGDLRLTFALFEPASEFIEPITHHHNRVSILVRGRVEIRVNGEEIYDLHPGDAVKLPAGHRVEFANPGDETAWVIAVNVGDMD
jgi:transcriptional regulator with XRE-family HTH domain